MNFLYRIFVKNYKNTKDNKVIKRYGLLAGITGIILNLVLFIVKIVIAIVTSSVAIISDAFNNLSDASSSIITSIGFKMSSKPADKEHPYGHQRIEYICAFVIAFIILLVGVELGISSFKKVINPTEVEFSYVTLIILCITVLVKVWMGIFYNKTSKIINSISLKASSKDSFNDVITTSFIILGLFIGKLFNFNIDGYLGLVVCIYILISGISLIKETIDKLIGGTPDKELIDKIINEVLKDEKILDVHDTLFHYYGHGEVYMSLHAEMDSSMSLVDAHNVVDSMEKKIKKMFNVELVIHVDPILLNDALLTEIHDKVKTIIKGIDNNLKFHELKVHDKKNRTCICFDLQVPFDFKYSNEELYNLINKEIKEINPNYRASINFDKD